ncbi:MAG: glycosyltransferase family 39 protein [Dehalococcoidia bacterium]|nr:glycosyltransferase family 39 protein [Dehalococcoidia bacterium]
MTETPAERSAAGPGMLAAVARHPAAAALAFPLALAVIVVVGAALRFQGLGWDQPAGANVPLQMHPDERFLSIVTDKIEWPSSVGEYFNTGTSPLNPYNAPDTPSFVYGTVPIFVAKAVSTWAGDDAAGPGNGYDTTVVWGRRLTAAIDTATILVVAGIATVLFGRRAGLLAALLYALAVLPAQLSHFWAADPYLVFFGALTTLFALLFVRVRSDRLAWLTGAAMGAAMGLAMASKVNALLFYPVIPAAALIRIGIRDVPRLGLTWRGSRAIGGHWMTDISVVCFATAVAIFAFRVAQPYAFTGPGFWGMSINPYWKTDVFEGEWMRQKGEINFPPFVQFAGRSPILYPLENMLRYGLGPGLGIAAWVSTAVGGLLIFRKRDLAFVLPVSLAAGIFGVQGIRFVTYLRYFAPAYPLLCVMAGWGCANLLRWATQGGLTQLVLPRVAGRRAPAIPARWLRVAAGGAFAVVVLSTAWWAIAFQNVYSSEHPRIAASRWIYENIPAGSRITTELWDDSIPYAIPGQAFAYQLVETTPYDTDSLQKVRDLVVGRTQPAPASVGLAGADYVAITSNRVRGSVPRLEREYPATIRYYQLLESGELGFDLVAHFEVRPSFLGITYDDSAAEESFTVYDHPEVWIYKKSERFNADRALALLNEAHPERAVDLLPRQGRTNGLQFTAEERVVQERGGTFRDAFNQGGTTSHNLPWLWWLLWLEAAAFAALPFTSWLFRAMPDRGYGFSKLAGLIGTSFGTWLVVAWGAAHFSGALSWAVFGAALTAGGLAAFVRRRTLLAEARARWRTWFTLEAVFLAAFFAFLWLRYANPDTWHSPQGGEKPVELAYLTAVARSTILPPFDPWLAGGTMNYYYMGWWFLAVPMRALRIVPEVAFNLGVPTFASLAAVTAASTVYNLVGLSARMRQRAAGRPGRVPVRPALIAAVFGAILLIGIGNLDGAHQMIERLQSLNTWGESWGRESPLPVVGEPVRWFARFLGGTAGAVGGFFQWTVGGKALPPFDWWRSSRVHIGQFDITEFPYWSALFADLHPHLMGLSFFGSVIALASALMVSAAHGGLRRQTWAIAAAMGLMLGLVRTVHTWDFPTAVLLTAAAIAAGQLLAPGRWQQRWWDGAGQLALAAGVLMVVFAPYTRHFEVFQSGIMKARETTKPNQYAAHFGVFLAFTVAFIAVRYWEELRTRGGKPGRNIVLATVAGRAEVLALAVFLLGLTTLTWRIGWWWIDARPAGPGDLGVPKAQLTVVALSAVLLVYLVNLAWLEFRSPVRDPARLIATAMLAAAVGVAGGVDVVTVKNDIVRMNTVFKFSLQAWQLYAVGCGYAGWYLATALWAGDGWRVRPLAGRRVPAVAGAVAAVLLLFGGGIYLVSGTKARQDARFAETPATLNGWAYLEKARYYEDRGTPAIADDRWLELKDDVGIFNWLRTNVDGSPTIAEAVGPLYHWTGRVSVNTGLPAVVGWDWHEIAYRMDYAGLIQERRGDTIRFYADPDPVFAATYLRKYNVRYVVVGGEERVFGTEAGIAKFAAMTQLSPVYHEGENWIYEVKAP